MKKHNMRPLFDIKQKEEQVKKAYTSLIEPQAYSDRFILLDNNTKERFTCKFYNKEKDEFIGSSLLAMYKLKEHFDRKIIEEVNNVSNN